MNDPRRSGALAPLTAFALVFLVGTWMFGRSPLPALLALSFESAITVTALWWLTSRVAEHRYPWWRALWMALLPVTCVGFVVLPTELWARAVALEPSVRVSVGLVSFAWIFWAAIAGAGRFLHRRAPDPGAATLEFLEHAVVILAAGSAVVLLPLLFGLWPLALLGLAFDGLLFGLMRWSARGGEASPAPGPRAVSMSDAPN